MPNNKSLYIIIALSLGIISGVMSTSMLNLVMDQIASTFNVPFSNGYFRNSIFFVTFSSSLLLFGKIVDSFSPSKIYNFGIILFCLSCILSILSIYFKSFPFYLMTQGFQGLADAMILSAIMSLIRNIFPENKIGWTFGIFGAIISTSVFIAPIAGSIIANYFHWSFIYLLQFFISSIALIVTYIFLPKAESKRKFISKSNYILYFICFLFLSLLQFLIIGKDFNDYKYLEIFSLLVLAIIFYHINKRSRDKFFPEDLFNNKRYAISCLRIFLIFLASNLFWMLIPSMLQIIYNFSLSDSGMILALDSLFLALISKKCGKYADKIPVSCILLGSSLPILGMLLINISRPEGDTLYIIISLIIITIGGAFSSAASNKIAMLSVSKDNVGKCMGFFQFLQFSSGSISASFILYISKENGEINKQIWDIIILLISLLYFLTFIISSINKRYFIISKEEIKC